MKRTFLLLLLCAVSFAQDGKVDVAVSKLRRQLEIIGVVRPYVERPDLGRLVILAAATGNLLTTIQERGPFHVETQRGVQHLVVTYRYSKGYLAAISSRTTARLLQELLADAEYVAKEFGFDDSEMKTTESVFGHLGRLVDVLVGSPLEADLRARLDGVRGTIGRMRALGADGDNERTLAAARVACRELRALYPDFYRVRPTDPVYQMTLEMQGLIEWYAERMRLDDMKSVVDADPELPPAPKVWKASRAPQIATGRNIACLMRQGLWTQGQTVVKCWGLGVYEMIEGQPLDVPALTHADAIAAAMSTVCALQDGAVKCWGYGEDAGAKGLAAKVNKVFASYKDVTDLAAGIHDFCLVDRKKGVKCFHGGYQFETDAPYALARKISIGGGSTCVIGGDGTPHCWDWLSGGRCGSQLESVPKEIKNPTQISVSTSDYSTRCRACVILNGDVRCWGLREEEDGKLPPTDLHHPSSLVQLSPTQRGQETTPCVVEDGRVLCRQKEGPWGVFPAYEDLKGVLVLAGSYTTTCAANEDVIRCHFGNAAVHNSLTIPHGIWFAPFTLAQIDGALEKLADDSYLAKGEMFAAGAKAFREIVEEESLAGKDAELFRLFFLNAYAPVVESTEAELFTRFLRPNWKSLLEKHNPAHGIKTLKDIPATPATRLAALSILKGTLALVRPAIVTTDGKARLDTFVTALGIAIASKAGPGTIADVVASFEGIRGEAEIMRPLVAYLR